jgi:hypothetical protein
MGGTGAHAAIAENLLLKQQLIWRGASTSVRPTCQYGSRSPVRGASLDGDPAGSGDRRVPRAVKHGEQDVLHARVSVGQTSGATQPCPIGDSARELAIRDPHPPDVPVHGAPMMLLSDHLSRAPTETAIRTRTCGLPLAGAASDQSGSRDQVDLRAGLASRWNPHSSDPHLRSRLLLRMSLEIRAQRSNDRHRGLAASRALSIDRQASDVGTVRAGFLSLEHNRIVRSHHSTPASRRMRFPSRPASYPCMVTQTSLRLSG